MQKIVMIKNNGTFIWKKNSVIKTGSTFNNNNIKKATNTMAIRDSLGDIEINN